MLHAFVFALAAQPKPKVIRHLRFHFGISVQTTRTMHTSGIGAGGGPISGVQDSTSGDSTQGTISADVVGLRPDMGLVVNVTEVSRQIPHSDSVQCITWGIGTVVCEPGKHTTPEEQALLRFLGRGFINPATIDSKNHWRDGTSSKQQTQTSDYYITANHDGVLDIRFQRVVRALGVGGFDATTDGTLTYDANLTVPREIAEDTLMRTQDNAQIGTYQEVHTMLNLKLLDDSMAPAKP